MSCMSRVLFAVCFSFLIFSGAATNLRGFDWAEDFNPIPDAKWNKQTARHLLERAGFSGTPRMIDYLASLSPRQAVGFLLGDSGVRTQDPFIHSGIFEVGIDPFPSSRPATTELAKKNGEALGIKVNNSPRPMQAIVNQFFYWLRASRLETDRVAYWWANQMLKSSTPLVDKMTLFWHGHFAVNEDKVRDYRKMHQQLMLFYKHGLGNFKNLVIKVAQDPAMLVFLDAGVNKKGSPNENFAREIMELFTMGPGNYSEIDIREGARAFTGWSHDGLEFIIQTKDQDLGEKRFLGQSGFFDGTDVIDIIFEQEATASFIAGKLYRFFVKDELSPDLQKVLGDTFRRLNYEIKPFLRHIFLSKDFYSRAVVGTRIKSPVEMVISTYKKLGLEVIPGSPDFNLVTGALGQRLMHPPTVAGWSYGKSWITPSLLIERGNFALDLMFPDIEFIPQDRYPVYPSGPQIRSVHRRLRQGYDISSASQPETSSDAQEADMVAMSNDMRTQEKFNTRYASYRGWQKAIERVLPISRTLPSFSLTSMISNQQLNTCDDAVRYLLDRFLNVSIEEETVERLVSLLEFELGTNNVQEAISYMEEPLRTVLHLILSLPEYQLG